MSIVRPGLNHSRWDPGLVMFPYLDAERAWFLIHEGDDLVLISRTRIRGMNNLLHTVHRFCADMRMKLAVEKTVILSSGSVGGRWVVSGDEPSLEASLVAKYLGVDLSIKGRNLVKAREARMISTATGLCSYYYGMHPDWLGQIRNCPEVMGRLRHPSSPLCRGGHGGVEGYSGRIREDPSISGSIHSTTAKICLECYWVYGCGTHAH